MPKTTKRKVPHRSRRLPKDSQGGIELLLIQSVEHLGEPGDVIHVKPGYAKNYLLPQGLATLATDHHKRMVEKHRARLREIQNVRLAGLRDQAKQLGLLSVTIEANANDEGHLYGSVGPAEIVNALKRSEITITPDQVRLKGPLKELGLYTVVVHIGQEVDAELKVWVVPAVSEEKASEEKAEPAE